PRDEPEVFLDGERVEEVRFVRNEGQPCLGGDGVGDQVVAGDADAARRGAQDAGEAAQCRRLAGTVRSDQPEHFRWSDLEGEVRDGFHIAEPSDDTVDLDHTLPSTARSSTTVTLSTPPRRFASSTS